MVHQTASEPSLSGVRLGLAMVGWLVCTGLFGGATSLVLSWLAPAWSADVNHLSVVIVVEVYSLLLIALVVAAGGPRVALSRLGLRDVSARQYGVAVLLWLGAYLCGIAVHGLGSTLLPAFPTVSELAAFLVFLGTDMGRLQQADGVTWGLVIVRACFLAPIAEELLFRGALFGWLRQRLSIRLTIVVTAAAFAAIHGFAPTMVPLAFLVGLAAGVARVRTGSTRTVVFVHVGQNCIIELFGIASLG